MTCQTNYVLIYLSDCYWQNHPPHHHPDKINDKHFENVHVAGSSEKTVGFDSELLSVLDGKK